MGGGARAEVIYFNWCWGGGGVASILGGSNSSLKIKLKPPRSGKIKNICDNKRLPQKLLFALHAENETPHGKNGMAPTWREQTAHIENETLIGETPPPSHIDFFIHTPPLGARLHPPCVRRS